MNHKHQSIPAIPRMPFLISFLFVVPMIVAAFGMKFFQDTYDWRQFFVYFSVVLSSFLGGIHWGFATVQYNRDSGKVPKRLILWSTLIAICSLIALLTKSLNISILLVFIILMVQWVVDTLILSDDVIPSWFRQIRNIISAMILIIFLFVLVG